jgi:UDP-N-acetylglucosamine 2-epimerase (non-hydrolysing)
MVSVHREENVDNPSNLTNILSVLTELTNQYKLPVIVSTHPRTRKRLEAVNTNHQSPITNHLIHFLKPFGFTDYVHLQQAAACTLSDSGTISEESAILSFPAISLRNSMERPEAQDAGTIILTGFDREKVLNSIEIAMAEHKLRKYNNPVADYSITDTSWRVLKLIRGLAGLSNKWSGVRTE